MILFDPRTEGEQLWAAIQAACPASPTFVQRMFACCAVKRYDGQTLVLLAPSAEHAEFLRQACTMALGEGRDTVAPGVKLVVTVAQSEAA